MTAVSTSSSEGVDICLVSAGLPSSNPRLVKEAAALVEAGYRVRCVVGDYPTPLRDYDAELIGRAGASMSRVGLGTKVSYKLRRTIQVAATTASRYRQSEWMLVRAGSPQSLRLFREAVRVPARMYLGHTLAALPAVVMAAESRGVLAGFDAEDCHSLETYSDERNRVAAAVERCFLPRCHHLTASSPLIAAEYRKLHSVTMTPILNVFDAPEARHAGRTRPSNRGSRSLYWFSQTVGPGRGLEQLIAGAALAKSDVQLCFRGIIGEDYREELVKHGESSGLARDIQFLPPAPPDSMIEKAAEHDVGLSLELQTPPNHDLALSNKLFTYIAAGIPQIVSRTAAQADLMKDLANAAILVNLESPTEIASAIDRLVSNEEQYASAAAAAWHLHRARYSWAVESMRLIEAIGQYVKPTIRPTADGNGTRNADEVATAGNEAMHGARLP